MHSLLNPSVAGRLEPERGVFGAGKERMLCIRRGALCMFVCIHVLQPVCSSCIWKVEVGQLRFHEKAQYYHRTNVDISNIFYKVKDN